VRGQFWSRCVPRNHPPMHVVITLWFNRGFHLGVSHDPECLVSHPYQIWSIFVVLVLVMKCRSPIDTDIDRVPPCTQSWNLEKRFEKQIYFQNQIYFQDLEKSWISEFWAYGLENLDAGVPDHPRGHQAELPKLNKKLVFTIFFRFLTPQNLGPVTLNLKFPSVLYLLNKCRF
jgi:hypothetical protein